MMYVQGVCAVTTLCIACDTEGPPLKTTYDKPINQSDIGLAWLSVFPHITKKK